eukprot:gene390-225_t
MADEAPEVPVEVDGEEAVVDTLALGAEEAAATDGGAGDAAEGDAAAAADEAAEEAQPEVAAEVKASDDGAGLTTDAEALGPAGDANGGDGTAADGGEAAPESPSAAPAADGAGAVAATASKELGPSAREESASKESAMEKLQRVSKTIRRGSSRGWTKGSRQSVDFDSARGSKSSIIEDALASSPMKRLADDFTYDESQDPDLQRGARDQDQLPTQLTDFERVDGFNFQKYQNLKWVSGSEIVYVNGMCACLFDVNSEEQRILFGKDSGGVGAVDISPKGHYLAVAETTSVEAVSAAAAAGAGGAGAAAPGSPGGPLGSTGLGDESPSGGKDAKEVDAKELLRPKEATNRQPRVFIYNFSTMKLFRILRKGAERAYVDVAFSPHVPNQLATLGAYPDYLLTVWNWKQEQVLLKCKAYGQEIFQ